MRFVCESCRAQYMINDEKVGPKGVKVRCRKCGYVILVKRSDAAAKVAAPVSTSNDPDDAMATQVMQSPLAADGAAAGDAPREPKKDDGMLDTSNFLGADEDEIGAVFDQVLASGAHPKQEVGGASEEDRQHTRVIDADTVKKLAEESADQPPPAAPAEELPQTDWYVAVNDKQTGPMTLDTVKGHWDKGEIGPDSLCWRPGYADWLPLSQVTALAAELAPKPPKPIVVASPATVPASLPAASVVSMPVQSAFTAGGMTQTMQSEVQIPLGGVPPSGIDERESTSTWKPSAASALASLVKDEMDALARPPPKKVEPAHEEVSVTMKGGLLDLPDARPAPSSPTVPVVPVERPAPPPVNPYMANPGATYSAPAVSQYRPQSNRGLIATIIGVVLLLVAVLIGLVVWLALRQPPVVVAPAPPPVVAPAPVVAAPSAVVPPVAAQPAPPAMAPTPAGTTPPPTAPTPTPAPVAAAPVAPTPVAAATPAPVPEAKGAPKTPVRVARAERPERVERREDPPEPKAERRQAVVESNEGDDFEKAFGGGGSSKKREEPKEEAPTSKKSAVYIPPAPGSAGDLKESLSPADVMEVVVANKPALAKCVEEQRRKDPGTSGKLVMKWTVQTNGRTSNVGVVTDEFRGSYIATCLTGIIKTWAFPRTKKQGEPVQFPFKF